MLKNLYFSKYDSARDDTKIWSFSRDLELSLSRISSSDIVLQYVGRFRDVSLIFYGFGDTFRVIFVVRGVRDESVLLRRSRRTCGFNTSTSRAVFKRYTYLFILQYVRGRACIIKSAAHVYIYIAAVFLSFFFVRAFRIWIVRASYTPLLITVT